MTWTLPKQSSFTFGKRSEQELAFGTYTDTRGTPLPAVNAKLQAVTRLALAISSCDFGIYDGGRSGEEAAANVAAGTSRADRSKHQDGLAIDAVPWVNGDWSWEAAHCFRVAYAHELASRFLRIPIVWGGFWGRSLAELGNPRVEHQTYIEKYRRENPGKEPLVDLVHYELRIP